MADDNGTPVVSPPPLPDIIQRYLNGESTDTIATDTRVARRTIYNWMHCNGDTEYYSLITRAMICRLADADEALHTATDSVQIARAREEAKFARFDLERRRSKEWGPKQDISSDNKITVIVQRSAPLQVVDTRSGNSQTYDLGHVSEAEVVGNANEMPSSDNNGQLT